MSGRLIRSLASSFPSIMGDPRRPARVLCGDGWYEVLERGMSEIQAFCDLCSESGSSLAVSLELVQERDGSLCFYHSIDGADDLEREILGDIIRNMELSSMYFCEVTGASPACLCRRGPRLRTLSYEIAVKDGYEMCSPEYASGWEELRAASSLDHSSEAPPVPSDSPRGEAGRGNHFSRRGHRPPRRNRQRQRRRTEPSRSPSEASQPGPAPAPTPAPSSVPAPVPVRPSTHSQS